MKRLLLGSGIAAALMLGAPAAAQASTGHHKHWKATVNTVRAGVDSSCQSKCRPPKTPPPGGWPCKADHSCATKHHYKPCPPPIVSHPVPPVVHNPPVRHDPKPPARQRVPVAAPVPEGLPRTGSNVTPLLLSSFGLIGGGALLRRKARVR